MKIYPMMFTGKETNGTPHASRKLGEIDFYCDDRIVENAERGGVAVLLNGQQLDSIESKHANFKELVDYFKMSNCQMVPDFYNALHLSIKGIDLVHLQIVAGRVTDAHPKYAYVPEVDSKIVPIKLPCSCPKDTVLHYGCKCGGT